jgi:signal transduction histidine kinase
MGTLTKEHRREHGIPARPGWSDATRVLAGGGDAGALARTIDWSQTLLGPVEGWSQALRSTVALLLHNHSPLLLWWGPEFVQIYNDAYRPVLGDKHPHAMGQRFRDCWHEVWDILGPMAERPFRGGPASTSDDLFLALRRKGFLEEAHFRVAYSPVPDDTVPGTGIGGVLATVTETTLEKYAERQLKTLRALGQRRAAEVRSAEAACTAAALTLGDNPWDVPFALLYLCEDGARARLAASVGFTLDELARGAPTVVDLTDASQARPWPLAEVAAARQVVLIDDLTACADWLPTSPWRERPRAVFALPLVSPDDESTVGVLVCGVSPHRELDEGYRAFFELAAAHVVTAIRNARAYQAARHRADELAALDRAKTSFFSNVSHEFRTPLTLMLGPTEDALASPSRALTGESLEIVHRSELRLLKLVNNLLDFTRLEAQRLRATYVPTDVARLTRELAGMFESAMARAGLEYVVEAEPIAEPVHLDRELYEKIVLNLLSNALKFTFEGGVRVSLRDAGDMVELRVRDTGVGVPADELPRLFERFYRVEGTRARTHEGSGIGLALVNDLVELHGGAVRAESTVGVGTTFVVTLRKGTRHLPSESLHARRASSPSLTNSFVEEALRWVPDDARPAPPTDDAAARARILVADDNADLREYFRRTLSSPEWAVEVVADGAAALAAARVHVPDVIVTDVMMRNLDGLGLLRALRADERTAAVPVIMVSARAGEEARVDGLAAGANEYLVKPFAARELLARIHTQLELARLRRAQDVHRRRLHSLFEQTPAVIGVLRGPEHVFELANPSYLALVGNRPLLARAFREALPELAEQGISALLDRAYATGEPIAGAEMPVVLTRGGAPEETYWNFVYQPYRGADGAVEGVMTFGFEITAQVAARKRVEALMQKVQESEAAAEAANRAKDEFLAVLGHELRNPLAPIMTALHLMRLHDDERTAKERSVIDRQAHHLVRLVDDLLDVSRITRGKVELKRSEVELAHIVARAIEMASPLLEQRQHSLSVKVATRRLLVYADPERMAQVVSNLLTNAAKYTEPGGQITIAAARQRGQIAIRVRDTGIGIAPEMLPRIFELFVQERQALDRSQGGLGLGLTIVRSLVALHGGTVEVKSEGRNLGSEFVVLLPALAVARRGGAGAHAADDAHVEAARPESGQRILVVDDNEDAAELLAASLEAVGHTVRVAHDGPAALEVAAELVPDVALLDIGLPVMDGYELARRIHAEPSLADVRLVALTGYGQEADRRRSERAGFAAHLVKPVHVEHLRALIAKLDEPA